MLGKLVGSSIDSLHEENCQKTYVATLSTVSSSRSFIIPLLMNSTPIRVLLDCGASDCFISPNFTTQHHLQTHPLSMPISLCLFDGTLKEKSIINHIPLTLSKADGIPCVSTHFLVSPLNPAYDAVLGLNWLTETNPAVNWSTREVNWVPVREPPIAELRAALSSDSEPSLAELHAAVTSDPALEPLYVEDYDDDSPPDLSGIPTPYREFSDVFSKVAALHLPPTRPFDHAMILKRTPHQVMVLSMHCRKLRGVYLKNLLM